MPPISNSLNLSVRMGDTLISPALPLCGPMVVVGGSPNVFIVKKPAMSLGDQVIPTTPVIPYVLPIDQMITVAQYSVVSGGVTSTNAIPDPLGTTFNWNLVTTPAPLPGTGSKTVFINKKPAMRVMDQILPLTFTFVPTQANVYIGG